MNRITSEQSLKLLKFHALMKRFFVKIYERSSTGHRNPIFNFESIEIILENDFHANQKKNLLF